DIEVRGREVLDAQLAAVVGGADAILQRGGIVDLGNELVGRLGGRRAGAEAEHGGATRGGALGDGDGRTGQAGQPDASVDVRGDDAVAGRLGSRVDLGDDVVDGIVFLERDVGGGRGAVGDGELLAVIGVGHGRDRGAGIGSALD